MVGTVSAIYTTQFAAAPLRSVAEATLEAGKGIVGDRYYQRRGTFSEKLSASADWEVTLIELEEIDRFNQLENLALPPGVFRRNLVTSGIRLNDLVGCRFLAGAAILHGVRLCEPCAHLATLVNPGVVKTMAHRAGLRARIIEGAVVLPGDLLRVYAAA